MTDGQILIATWKRICVAVDCENKRTAKKKLKALGIKVVMINGVAHINGYDLTRKFK